MARGTGGTIYLIGLIFAIIVAFVLLGVASWMNTRWTEVSTQLAQVQKQLADEKGAIAEKDASIAQLNKIINGGTGAVSYDGIATNSLAEANRKLQEMLNEEYTAAADWQAIKDPTIKEVWEKLATFKDKSDKYTNLMDFQADCLKNLQAVLHVVPRLRLDRLAALDEVVQVKKQVEEIKNQKESEIRDLQKKYNDEVDNGLQKARLFDLDKKRYLEQIDKLQKEGTRLQKDHTNALVRLENEIKNRQRRIDEFAKRTRKTYREILQPDGEVTFADAQLGYAWIDIGKAHGLKRGTRFQVYQYTKGGRQKVKAYCEVKKVDEDMAQVAILPDQEDVDPDTHEKSILPDANDPVVKGDLIRSLVFKRDAQPKFYFLGQKLSNRYYNRAELEKKIEEFGGKVQKDLTVEVDYVVVLVKGEEDTKNYDLATQLGATFVREDELLDYIGK